MSATVVSLSSHRRNRAPACDCPRHRLEALTIRAIDELAGTEGHLSRRPPVRGRSSRGPRDDGPLCPRITARTDQPMTVVALALGLVLCFLTGFLIAATVCALIHRENP